MMLNFETDSKTEIFWNKLSHDERIKLLKKYEFWDGFSRYLWQYLPDYLREAIWSTIASNCV